jgi:hypothetical protein
MTVRLWKVRQHDCAFTGGRVFRRANSGRALGPPGGSRDPRDTRVLLLRLVVLVDDPAEWSSDPTMLRAPGRHCRADGGPSSTQKVMLTPGAPSERCGSTRGPSWRPRTDGGRRRPCRHGDENQAPSTVPSSGPRGTRWLSGLERLRCGAWLHRRGEQLMDQLSEVTGSSAAASSMRSTSPFESHTWRRWVRIERGRRPGHEQQCRLPPRPSR